MILFLPILELDSRSKIPQITKSKTALRSSDEKVTEAHQEAKLVRPMAK
jgi:hypothetical protein